MIRATIARRFTLILLVTCLIISCNNNSINETNTTDITQDPSYQRGLELATSNKCFTCHQIEGKLTGPSYREIAKKYAPASKETISTLAQKIIKGGIGNWGEIYMTPHPQLSEKDAETLVKYILLLKK